jgi:hypothetical protein
LPRRGLRRSLIEQGDCDVAIAFCLAVDPRYAPAHGVPSGAAGQSAVDRDTKDTPEQVNKSIRAALLSGQWLVTADNPGEIDGTLARNDYSANIAVFYDDKKIQIRYVGSSNLKYEKKNGVEYIHRNYLVWVRDLTAQIQSNLLLFGS